MKAVVYEDIDSLVLKECEKPKLIEDTDAVSYTHLTLPTNSLV